jgi:hypothetical protein
MQVKQKYRSYAPPVELKLAISCELDGSEYDQGAMEDTAATVGNVATALSGLLALLVERGMLSLDDLATVSRDLCFEPNNGC